MAAALDSRPVSLELLRSAEWRGMPATSALTSARFVCVGGALIKHGGRLILARAMSSRPPVIIPRPSNHSAASINQNDERRNALQLRPLTRTIEIIRVA